MKESMSITVPKGYSGTLGQQIAQNLRLLIVEISDEDIEFATSSEDEEFATSSDEEAAPQTTQNANKKE
jgi:hypothetical protein